MIEMSLIMKNQSKIARWLMITAGSLCVGLGIVGMFVPLLPTTPFLLLAAFLYIRSSERFHRWLLTNRLCGKYIRNYQDGRGIPRKQKALTIALLWLTITASAIVLNKWWITLLLLAVAIAVTTHLLRVKTSKKEQPGSLQKLSQSESKETGEC